MHLDVVLLYYRSTLWIPVNTPTLMAASKRKKLSVYLTLAMIFTMLMGPGPGLRLVNPDVNGPPEQFAFAGIPVIYLWGIFWFIVQVLIIITAYLTVWNEKSEVAE